MAAPVMAGDETVSNTTMADGLMRTVTQNVTTNVTTDVTTDVDHGLWISSIAAYAVPVLFFLIFVVGVAGNGAIVYVVCTQKQMRNVPNVLLVSLALGDMLLIVVSVPFTATIYSLSEWPYGEVACRCNAFLQALSLGVSVFTLVALSADRYFAIKNPMRAYQTASLGRTVGVALLIWLVSLLLAGYKLRYAHVATAYVYCRIYPAGWARFIVMFNFVVYFALPMTVITAFYVRMAHVLVASSFLTGGESCASAQMRKQLAARKKVSKLVLCFVLVFVVCWLPRHVYLLWYHYDGGEYDLFWHVFKIVGFCLSFTNSCVNPLALYLLSRQFRLHFNRCLLCCCRRRRHVACAARGDRRPTGPANRSSSAVPDSDRLTGLTVTQATTAL